MSESDVKKDFQQAYEQAQAHWAPFLGEARKDLQCTLGDQWDPADKSYLANQRRAALVFNKVRRVVKLVEGYQRKNRLSLKVQPVEGSDEATASQLSAVIQWQMQASNAYHTLSDAFSAGALKCGLNLVNLFVDYSSDPANGDIRVKRVPYNKFFLDPNFTERDLSDCGHVLRREYLSKDAVKALLPASARKNVDGLKVLGEDEKFPDFAAPRGVSRDNLYRYDEFWRRVWRPVTLIGDPASGTTFDWTGSRRRLRALLEMFPDLKVMETMKKGVELCVLVEGRVLYRGPEPSGLDDYPFVPVLGFFDPEYEDSRWKLQSMVRCMRDPQTEVNKRRSKMLDIIDSQISTGWKAVENSVVNPEALYQSGQGQVVWMKSMGAGALNNAERLLPPEIPPGLMQLSQVLDKDIMEIPGANSELFGMPENEHLEVAGIVAKMRQASGLTILQDIFDNYRLAKKLVGRKMISMVQKNYGPDKIQRIINQPPAAEFYSGRFGKYDAVPVEGALTDSQRQMNFAQMLALKRMGAPISWELILDAAPMEDKGALQASARARKKAGALAAQNAALAQQVQAALAMAGLQAKMAETALKQSQARENASTTLLNRARAAREMVQARGHAQEQKARDAARILSAMGKR